ncbi:MAG: metallophosphoesterase, partial [Desulfitobacteriaceae bacterium]|nr:metallophosphoesterase [Desulfitobacteriaceae bacterium]
ARQFYQAKCECIVFDPLGDRIPSPDPTRTPAYCRAVLCPAWFRLSEFRSLTQNTFKKEFGDIPLGDPTLFLVEQDPSGKRSIVYERVIPLVRQLDTHSDSILHISDLHFGADHGFLLKTESKFIPQICLADRLIRYFSSNERCKPGVVIVSGDITTKGDANGYVYAQEFFNKLLDGLNLQRTHVVLVPGNHDMWLVESEHPTVSYDHEAPYRYFLQALYMEQPKELECLKSYQTPSGWIFSFVGLNSARAYSKDTKDYGYVGEHRYAPWLQEMASNCGSVDVKSLVKSKRINFAVMHHHILPALMVCQPQAGRPVSLTLDAGQIVEDFQKFGIGFVLHGHQHVPFVGSTGRARRVEDGWKGHEQPLFVVGMGSTGAGAQRLSDEIRENTFGIYTPKEDGLEVRIELFNPQREPTPHMEFLIPWL